MSTDLLTKFTSHLKTVLTRALAFVMETGNETITPAHLLWALGMEEGSIGSEILKKSGATPSALQALVGAHAQSAEVVADPSRATPLLSDDAKRVLEKAILSAGLHHHKYVGTEHLLYGLLSYASPEVKQFFTSEQISTNTIDDNLTTIFKTTADFPEATLNNHQHDHQHKETKSEEQKVCEECGHVHKTEDKDNSDKGTALDFFAVDLTKRAAAGTLDPAIGRERELARVMNILARRTKNNPLLLGEAGVGKTAIVEELARRLATGKVPDALIGCRLLRLDMANMVADTMYRGDFEQRLTQILEEVRERPNVILFIDEIHTVVGAGSASGSLDAANILKPALSRGEIRCIGATTAQEYKKHIESDAALERRFAPLTVNEPDRETALLMVRGVLPVYEKHHHVTFTDEALEAVMNVADVHMPGRQFPDKAIDLLDEVGAMAKAGKKSSKKMLAERALTVQLERLRKEKMFAVADERFGEAVQLKEQEEKLQEELKTLATDELPAERLVIDDSLVRKVAAQMTGIPLERLTRRDEVALRTLEKRLKTHVLGQEAAVQKVTLALQRAKLGLQRKNRPLASFLFAGPSGVGKTELARAVARELFHDPKALLRFDMSEFGEGFGVSKLLGSPAGYVGYREGAKLTDAVKARPHSVVLFDELEKAHRDVQNLLLQILDEGEITDAAGRAISFRNTVVVMTTNAGREIFERGALGFGGSPEALKLPDIRSALEEHFRPELLNRVDHTAVFQPLTHETLVDIVEKNLGELAQRLGAQKITLGKIDQAVSQHLAKKVIRKHGARDIHRIIEELVETPFVHALLKQKKETAGSWKLKLAKNGKVELLATKVGSR